MHFNTTRIFFRRGLNTEPPMEEQEVIPSTRASAGSTHFNQNASNNIRTVFMARNPTKTIRWIPKTLKVLL